MLTELGIYELINTISFALAMPKIGWGSLNNNIFYLTTFRTLTTIKVYICVCKLNLWKSI